jgi:bifunctional UDP-N-acetylglucosamine pyrophosphorylase/glucosamine-1-phosphate N-acetyltransferase
VDKIGLVILAAGKGKRLKTSFPKPLAPILGRTLVDCVVGSVQKVLANSPVSFVIGHEREMVQNHIQSQNYFSSNSMDFVVQEQQNGTGHALRVALENSKAIGDSEYIMVLCADTPCLSPDLFKSMIDNKKDLDALVVTFQPENPFGYGRVFDDGSGKVTIVEEKDASDEQRKHNVVNSGIYIFKKEYLNNSIGKLNNENASGEFYLTDLMSFTEKAGSFLADNPMEFIGVNDLVQLNQAESFLRKVKLKELMLSGVVVKDIETTSIDPDVEIGADSVLHPNVEILGSTRIGTNVLIERGSIIRDSSIGSDSIIKANSYIDESTIAEKVKIGPMAQLRPGSEVGNGTKIGNFVELKKVKLDENVSISHLSYVGDAEVGSGSNLGCGFISCNYDGANKHLTKIGKNTFIGSDSQMVAPINIGDNCYVASGSTINQDMPDGAFAIARTRQVTKEGLARKFLKKKK